MLCARLVEIGPVVLEKKILKFVNVFSLYHNYLPLKKGSELHLNKLKFHLPKDALYQVWLKLAQWLRSDNYKIEKYIDKSFFFLQNQWANLNETWHKVNVSLGEVDSS